MVPLNTPTFYFSSPKIFFRFLVPPKFFIHEISLCSQCRAGTNFVDEIFLRDQNLRNILGGLKSNVGIFNGTIYLFNPTNFVNQFFMGLNYSFSYICLLARKFSSTFGSCHRLMSQNPFIASLQMRRATYCVSENIGRATHIFGGAPVHESSNRILVYNIYRDLLMLYGQL